MRYQIKRFCLSLLSAVFFIGSVICSGCEGGDTHKAVDDTVREVSGGKMIDKGKSLEEQVHKLNAQEIERIQKDIEKGTYGEDQ